MYKQAAHKHARAHTDPRARERGRGRQVNGQGNGAPRPFTYRRWHVLGLMEVRMYPHQSRECAQGCHYAS